MIKLCILIASTLCLASTQSYNLNPEFKLIGPEELTAFLVDRLGGQFDWDFAGWSSRSDKEVQDIFAKHSQSYINPAPCLDVNCKKAYTEEVEGTGNIASKVSDGNKTSSASGQITGSSLSQLFMEKDGKEEAHCLVVCSNTTFANQGEDFNYSVDMSASYGGGVRIKLIMDPGEIETEHRSNDEQGLVKLHIIKATSKSKLEETAKSDHYASRRVKSMEISATVVTFDSKNCDNSVDSVNCDTLARVYHHIKSSTERNVQYKDKSKSYKADSYGTIITVIKKA